MSARICVVGLGNPGSRYDGTRHNIGFEWIDSAVEKISPESRFSEKFNALWLSHVTERGEIHFLKPPTYMNESGRSLAKWREKYQGECRILIVLDDIDLPLGRLRLRAEGSDGGHRGLRSILDNLGSDSVARLRLGIGRPTSETVDYVLEKFNLEEKAIVTRVVGGALEHLQAWIENPFEIAMSKINGLNFVEKAE